MKELVAWLASLTFTPNIMGEVTTKAQQRLESMRRTGKLAAWTAVILILLGVTISGLAYNGDDTARGVIWGHRIIAAAGAVVAGLLLLLRVKFGINVWGAYGAKKLANEIVEAFPEFTAERAEKFVREFCGMTVWVTLLLVWCSFIPIYRYPILFFMIIPVIFGIQGMIEAGWVHGTAFRTIAFWTLALLFLCATVKFLSPGFARDATVFAGRMTAKTGAWINKAFGTTVRDEAVHQAEEAHAKEAAKLDALSIETKRARQRALISTGIDCNRSDSRFCSADDERDYNSLEQDIQAMLQGEAGKKKPEPEAPKPTASVSSPTSPAATAAEPKDIRSGGLDPTAGRTVTSSVQTAPSASAVPTTATSRGSSSLPLSSDEVRPAGVGPFNLPQKTIDWVFEPVKDL